MSHANKTSVDDRLRAMRDDLSKLVTALNQDEQFNGARRIQAIIVSINGLIQPGALASTDRWAWPPRFTKDGAYVLVES